MILQGPRNGKASAWSYPLGEDMPRRSNRRFGNRGRDALRQGLFLRVREEAEEHEDNLCLQVRWRAVFRCDGTDIPQPGWNIWYSEDLYSETKVL